MYKSEPRHTDGGQRIFSNLLISHFLWSDWTFGMCVCLHRLHKSYLLLLSALQIPPLLCYVAEVHLVHGHLDVADRIVLGEAVKIVHRHYQRLSAELYVGDLSRTTVTDKFLLPMTDDFLLNCCSEESLCPLSCQSGWMTAMFCSPHTSLFANHSYKVCSWKHEGPLKIILSAIWLYQNKLVKLFQTHAYSK